VATATSAQRRLAGRLGGVGLTGGATVIADGDGRIRHVSRKPVPSDGPQDPGGQAALERVLAFVAECAGQVPEDERLGDPHWMRTRYALARIHPD
jgi:hypothetical protein